MQADEFREFLSREYLSDYTGHPLKPKPARDAVWRCDRVERTLQLDLDKELTGAVSADALCTMIDREASKFEIDGDEPTGLSSLKTAVRRYFDFLRR